MCAARRGRGHAGARAGAGSRLAPVPAIARTSREHIGGFPTLPLLASRGCIRPLLVLLDPHVLSHGARQGRARAQAGQSDRGDAAPQPSARRPRLPVPGRRLPAVGKEGAALGRRAGRADARQRACRERRSGRSAAAPNMSSRSCSPACARPGLFLVYMGIESGVDRASTMLFKQMTVEQNLDAVGP